MASADLASRASTGHAADDRLTVTRHGARLAPAADHCRTGAVAWLQRRGCDPAPACRRAAKQACGRSDDEVSFTANESCLPPSAANDEGLSPSQFRRVLPFISARLSSNLTPSELAREAGLSAAYFSQRFKSSTGTSPHQYLLRLRICRARTLLEESEAPVIDIAAECGFQTQQHFARIFSQVDGQNAH
jgi:transcriptional regulator GlxA family with amidase domain